MGWIDHSTRDIGVYDSLPHLDSFRWGLPVSMLIYEEATKI